MNGFIDHTLGYMRSWMALLTVNMTFEFTIPISHQLAVSVGCIYITGDVPLVFNDIISQLSHEKLSMFDGYELKVTTDNLGLYKCLL